MLAAVNKGTRSNHASMFFPLPPPPLPLYLARNHPSLYVPPAKHPPTLSFAGHSSFHHSLPAPRRWLSVAVAVARRWVRSATLRSQQRQQLHACCHSHFLCCPFSSGIANPEKPIFSNGPHPSPPLPQPGSPLRSLACPGGERGRPAPWGLASPPSSALPGPESESRRPKLSCAGGAF